MRRCFWTFGAIICLSSCQDGSKIAKFDPRPGKHALTDDARKFANFEIRKFEALGDLAAQPLLTRADLRTIFCVDGYKLPMFADFNDLLGLLCTDGQPNPRFEKLDQFAGHVGDKPYALEVDLKNSEDGYSAGIYVVAYRVPVAPKWLRTASIPTYMVSSIEFDDAKSSGQVTADLTKTIGGTLQFGKWTTSSKMDIATPSGESVTYVRTTELNSYQVQGGNSDLGLALEHRTSGSDANFRQYRVMTVSIANQDGSTTMITFMNMEMANRGFPDFTRQLMNNMANAQNIRIHAGIIAEHRIGYFDDKKSR